MYGLFSENVENNLRNWKLLRVLIFKSCNWYSTYTITFYGELNNFVKVETMICVSWETKTTIKNFDWEFANLRDEIKRNLDFCKEHNREILMNKKG